MMRHLRAFENSNSTKQNYCLFVAPRLHPDTVNTFYTSVKYEYEGRSQKIIPITITQLIRLLTVVKNTIKSGNRFSNNQLREFYDTCTQVSSLRNSTE